MVSKEANKSKYLFFILLFAAFILSYIPILHYPFSWIMTFFHEISHGIGALITGGSIEKIVLHINGAGLCYTSGGIRFVILQLGYIGAVLWGALIYEMADDINDKNTKILSVFLAGLIFISTILYARDIISWIILGIIFTLFISIIKVRNAQFVKISLKFVGLYVLLDAIKAPLHLLDGRHYGDGAKLSDITFLPEIVWIFIWLSIGLLALYFIHKRNLKLS